MTFLDIVEGLRVGLNVCGTPNTKQQSGHCFVEGWCLSREAEKSTHISLCCGICTCEARRCVALVSVVV